MYKKIVQASKFLREVLRVGPRPVTEIVDLAVSRGIIESVLHRAMGAVGAVTSLRTSGWQWSLPKRTDPQEFGVPEAEVVVLGHILTNGRNMTKAMSVIGNRGENDFSSPINFLIFETMRALWGQNKVVYLASVLDLLEEAGVLERVGEDYILGLVVAAARAPHAFSEALNRLDQQRIAERPVEIPADVFEGIEGVPVGWGREAYLQYLASEQWRVIRIQAIKRDGGRCRTCNSSDGLQVHHRTYERLGHEDPGDLTTLCGRCHEVFSNSKTRLAPTYKVTDAELQSNKVEEQPQEEKKA